MVESRLDVSLLIGGREAFPEIARRIRAAERSVYVNMFIWRDDGIGNRLAAELLHAAERGVRVTIVKDRYGIVCEQSEECRASFFHPRPKPAEWVKIFGLELLYNADLMPQKRPRGENALRDALLRHPNVTVSADENRHDHSKFWVFDDETLILGGINVENKEDGADRAGRRYRDYMVELRGAELVRRFWQRRGEPTASEDDVFAFNLKSPRRCFELKDRYLRLIDGAAERLTILMAYFSPDADILRAVEAAAARGVDVCVAVPARANFTDANNKRTLQTLYGIPGVTLYLSDYMLHAKLLMSEKELSIGSCNVSKKAFRQLDELNVFLPNDGGAFAASVRESVKATIAEAQRVTDPAMLRHSALLARLESVLV